ncbi:MAG: HNH endonuclease signature motif containing protein [Pseudonocardiaceae bacterium]
MSLERGTNHWGTNPGDPIGTEFAAIDSSFDKVLATDPLYWTTAQKKMVLAWLEKYDARQAALRLRVLAVADDIAEETGDKDASAWIRAELLVDKGAARAQIKLAAQVAKHALVDADLAAGKISQSKARVVTKTLADIEANPIATTEDLILAEKLLVDYATRLTAKELQIVGRRILAEIDPARFEDAEAKALLAEEERALQKTALRVWNNGDGTIGFDGVLPVAIGARFKTQVEAWAQPRKQRLVAKGAPLPPWERLMGQGFARLIETIDPDALPRHGGDATVVNVVISLEELRKELGTAMLGFDETNGHTISAAEARKMACNATIIPWVLGGDGQVLDAGRFSRFFQPIQRKALRLQQKCCQAEGCDMPPEWCDAHHLTAWALGGKTDLKDGVLLCPHHHRLAHAPGYTHERLPDGTIRFTRRP